MGVENTVLFMLIILSELPPPKALNPRSWDHYMNFTMLVKAFLGILKVLLSFFSHVWKLKFWRLVFKYCLLTYFTMPMWVQGGKIIVANLFLIILTKPHTIYNNNKLCSFEEIIKVKLFSDARHTTNEHKRRQMAVSHLNYLHCPFSKNYFVYLEKM